MPFSLHGVQSTSTLMLQGGSLHWKKWEAPSADGDVYVAPDCPDGLAAQVIEFSGLSPGWRSCIGRGAYGSAYKVGNSVIKRFKVRSPGRLPESVSGLAGLQANVALHEGLRKVGPLHARHPFLKTEMAYHITSPRLFAAFIPYEAASNRRPVWAMSFELGKRAKVDDLPKPSDRLVHYSNAVASCGVLHAVDFDDNIPGNTLVRPSNPDTGHINLTKLDVAAVMPLI